MSSDDKYGELIELYAMASADHFRECHGCGGGAHKAGLIAVHSAGRSHGLAEVKSALSAVRDAVECPECNIRFDPQWKEKDAAHRGVALSSGNARDVVIGECRRIVLACSGDAEEAAKAKDATDYVAGYQDAVVDCDEALRDMLGVDPRLEPCAGTRGANTKESGGAHTTAVAPNDELRPYVYENALTEAGWKLLQCAGPDIQFNRCKDVAREVVQAYLASIERQRGTISGKPTTAAECLAAAYQESCTPSASNATVKPQEGHCLLQVPQQTKAKPSPCAMAGYCLKAHESAPTISATQIHEVYQEEFYRKGKDGKSLAYPTHSDLIKAVIHRLLGVEITEPWDGDAARARADRTSDDRR